jgi:hypothetical protein
MSRLRHSKNLHILAVESCVRLEPVERRKWWVEEDFIVAIEASSFLTLVPLVFKGVGFSRYLMVTVEEGIETLLCSPQFLHCSLLLNRIKDYLSTLSSQTSHKSHEFGFTHWRRARCSSYVGIPRTIFSFFPSELGKSFCTRQFLF